MLHLYILWHKMSSVCIIFEIEFYATFIEDIMTLFHTQIII